MMIATVTVSPGAGVAVSASMEARTFCGAPGICAWTDGSRNKPISNRMNVRKFMTLRLPEFIGCRTAVF